MPANKTLKIGYSVFSFLFFGNPEVFFKPSFNMELLFVGVSLKKEPVAKKMSWKDVYSYFLVIFGRQF